MKKKYTDTYNIKKLLKKPSNMLEIFHDKTKWTVWAKPLPSTQWPKSWMTTYFKEYPRLDKIILPKPVDDISNSLKDTLMTRHSERVFGKTPMTLEQISNLLYYSAGLKTNVFPWSGNRTYASPGGRYTLETYIISQNSELPLGLYHYNLRSHSLEVLTPFETFDIMEYATQDWISNASIIIFLTATFQRNTMKYGIRGYRHVMQEAGHLGQNFYLVATGLGLAVCASGGYLEERVDALLDVDGLNETTIYMICFGNKKEQTKQK